VNQPPLNAIEEVGPRLRELTSIQERQELLALAAGKLPPERRDFTGFEEEMTHAIPSLVNLRLTYLQAESQFVRGQTTTAGGTLGKAVEMARTLLEQLPADWHENFLAGGLPAAIKELGIQIRNQLEND